MKNAFLEKFSPNYNRGIGLVLALSGLFGFIIGSMALPTWQVAVETAQVVGGLVEYPHDNPFYMYHVKLWTILHQFVGLLLKLGVSEQTASTWISGLLGMVTFQAFSTIILALSGDWLVAIGGALVIFFGRPNEFGVMYPVTFMGSEHTYGVLGLSYLLLVIGLMGGGWRKGGAFLLGLAPAVHPSLGFWLGVIVAGCCLWDIRRFRENWAPWLKYFFIGGAVSTISLIIQLAFITDMPKIAPFDEASYFNAFVSFWDLHRSPVDKAHPGIAYNWWVLVLAVLALFVVGKDLPSNSALILRAAAVSSALGLGAMALSWVSPDKVPRTLLMLMPSRLLNVAIVASLPVLIGIVGAYRDKITGKLLMLALLVGVLLGGPIDFGGTPIFTSSFWPVLQFKGVDLNKYTALMINPWICMIVIAIAITLFGAITRWKLKIVKKDASGKHKKSQEQVSSPASGSSVQIGLRYAIVAVLVIFLVLTTILSSALVQKRGQVFADNPVLTETAKGKGMLLTGGNLHLIQLRTRRPVLLDGGGLDGIAYVMAAAPAMNQILREVYNVDLFNPPEEAAGSGSVPNNFNRMSWENFQPQQWLDIAKKYGIHDVLTPGDWNLDLPRVAEDETYVLYRIPEMN